MSEVKMVAVNCPNCGAPVTQDDAKDGYCTCSSCGTTFVIKDDMIKIYQIATVDESSVNAYEMSKRQAEYESDADKFELHNTSIKELVPLALMGVGLVVIIAILISLKSNMPEVTDKLSYWFDLLKH